jgi:hypothetical protein
MGNLRVSNEVILAKIETTYNTDPTPVVGTDAKLVQNVSFQEEGPVMVERPSIQANINQLQSAPGPRLGRISFAVELKGSGAAGTAPELGTLLRGCALGETVVGATSVTYKPISSAHESITIYWYEGGRKLHILTGCRGNVVFGLTAGGIVTASFEFVGHYANPSDIAQPTPTYNSQVPKVAMGMAVSLGAVTSMIVRGWTINLNNQLAMPPSVAAADGYGQVQVTRQDVAGELTMDAELASVIDVDAQLSAGTGITFGSGTLGGTAGNRATFSSATNGLYWRGRQFGEADGMRIRTLPFGLKDSTTTAFDAVAVAFT